MPLLGRSGGRYGPATVPAPTRRWQGAVSIVGPGSHNANVLLVEIAETSRAVATTSARLAKRELLAGCLRRAAPGEGAIAVVCLPGALPQRQIGGGWAALRERPSPAAEPTLTVAEVDAAFTEIGQVSG